MRRFIVDTDTASDDAAALMIAALSEEIDLLGVTIVAGNVGLKQATDNALMTLEVCGSDAPVYLGAKRPLFRERHETISVHGKDGMGDCDIIHPKRSPEEKRAVEFILEQVERYPNEVELVVLGPATNIALAILTDREIMSKVKHIWSMGTPGFGFGNATPVSEFNVFIDAEAYALMLDLEIPVTIAGFDLCAGNIGLDRYELSYLAHGSKPAQFLEQATSKLLQFNLDPERLGKQAERTGRPESRNHPRHPGRECLGQRTAGHTGSRGKRGSGNSGKAARAGTGRIRRSHQNSKA